MHTSPSKTARILKPLAAAIVLAGASSVHAASPFDQIVVFGDSLSDSGQFPDASGPFNTAYGVPGSGLRFTNRVDGAGSVTDLVAVQLLSQKLGLGYLAASTPYLPSPVTGYPAGTNYAVGGNTSAQIKASITDANGSVVYNPAAGPAKVRDGYLVGKSVSASTLFYVNGGGNDVLATFAPAPTAMVDAANTLVSGIEALHSAGAKYIMVSNLPDVGTTPAGIGSGLAPVWTANSVVYNDALYAGLRSSGANIIPVDARGLVTEVLANPTSFGLMADVTMLTATCYDGGGGSCLENPAVGINSAGADPSKLLFNDGVHPTAVAQQIVADYTFSLIQAPQEVGQLPLLGASLVDADQLQLRQQMQANAAAKKLNAGNWQVFARGASSELQVRDNYADGSHEDTTALLGLQYAVSEKISVGLGLASNSGDLSFADSDSSYNASSLSLSVFANVNEGNHWANASLHYGKQDYDDLVRVFNLGLTQRTESGATEGSSIGISAEYGYNISPHSNWEYGPSIELAYRSIEVDGYDESSGLTTALRYDSQKHTSTTADAGIFVHYRALENKLVVTSEWGIRNQLTKENYSVTMSNQTLDLNSYELPGYVQDKGQAWHGNLSASYYLTDSAAVTASWQTEQGDNRYDLFGLGVSLSF